MKHKNYLTPYQISALCAQGRESEIPKSKTWHKFMEWYKDCGLTVTTLACKVGIPLVSMSKFMDGTYIISQTNLRKIQEFLKKIAYDKTQP